MNAVHYLPLMPEHWNEQTSCTLLSASASVSLPGDREMTAAVCSRVKRRTSSVAETTPPSSAQAPLVSHVQLHLTNPLPASVHGESSGPGSVTAIVTQQLHAVTPVMTGTAVSLWFHGHARM